MVDLNEITFIDKSGERLLRLLVSEGAQCIASSACIKHVLDRLAARRRSRLLNLFAVFLFAVLLAVLVCAISANASKQAVATNVRSGLASEQVLSARFREKQSARRAFNHQSAARPTVSFGA